MNLNIPSKECISKHLIEFLNLSHEKLIQFTSPTVQTKYQNTSLTNHHFHHSWEIKISFSGNIPICIGEKNFLLKENHVLLIPPKIRHRTDESIIKSHEFSGSLFCITHEENKLDIAFHTPLDSQAYTLSEEELFSLNKGLPTPPFNFLSHLLQLVKENHLSINTLWLLYLENIWHALKEKRNLNSPSFFLNQICNYIIDNFNHSDLSLNKISQNFHISPNHLNTLMKKYFHISFHDYLTNTRMKKALDLLQFTSLNMSEVAQAVGYKDPLYFSKVIKKKFGKSPLHLRQTQVT